jgi:hypothetical protein
VTMVESRMFMATMSIFRSLVIPGTIYWIVPYE